VHIFIDNYLGNSILDSIFPAYCISLLSSKKYRSTGIIDCLYRSPLKSPAFVRIFRNRKGRLSERDTVPWVLRFPKNRSGRGNQAFPGRVSLVHFFARVKKVHLKIIRSYKKYFYLLSIFVSEKIFLFPFFACPKNGSKKGHPRRNPDPCFTRPISGIAQLASLRHGAILCEQRFYGYTICAWNPPRRTGISHGEVHASTVCSRLSLIPEWRLYIQPVKEYTYYLKLILC